MNFITQTHTTHISPKRPRHDVYNRERFTTDIAPPVEIKTPPPPPLRWNSTKAHSLAADAVPKEARPIVFREKASTLLQQQSSGIFPIRNFIAQIRHKILRVFFFALINHEINNASTFNYFGSAAAPQTKRTRYSIFPGSISELFASKIYA